MSNELNNNCDIESLFDEIEEIKKKSVESSGIKQLILLLSNIVSNNAILMSQGKISSEEYRYRLNELEKVIGRSGIVDKLMEYRSLLDWIRL